ncbi:GNAT family N-acetyltransferase [Herbiconiux liangxiaofengii]|uniref:GNAT family N-acetyltransferase n=1 Tax=Herbiconiux liangxiaofengii TaxID=3342795 RepID=UPI0035B730D6
MFTIAPASPADLPAASAALASAFEHDTVMGTLTRGADARGRLELLFLALTRSGGLTAGRLDLARRDSDGLILGAAIWEAPGHRASLLAQARQLPAFLRALGARGLLAAARVQSTLAEHRPAEPHWYLAQIGVTAEARGAGVGSALLDRRLTQIDLAGEAAYLESSNERNRALYRRHGFTSIGQVHGIPDARPAAMWRRPQPLPH